MNADYGAITSNSSFVKAYGRVKASDLNNLNLAMLSDEVIKLKETDPDGAAMTATGFVYGILEQKHGGIAGKVLLKDLENRKAFQVGPEEQKEILAVLSQAYKTGVAKLESEIGSENWEGAWESKWYEPGPSKK